MLGGDIAKQSFREAIFACLPSVAAALKAETSAQRLIRLSSSQMYKLSLQGLQQMLHSIQKVVADIVSG